MMLDIFKSIVQANPQVEQRRVLELKALVEKMGLHWIPSFNDKKAGAYFIASQVSEKKSLDKLDYAKHWSDSQKSNVESDKRYVNEGNVKVDSHVFPNKEYVKPLAGKEFKLEGHSLSYFKDLYRRYYNIDLGKINKLLIVDWIRAYSYIVQGNTETAQVFQELGANAVIGNSNEELISSSHFNLSEIDTTKEKKQEQIIHNELNYLLARMRSTWVSEFSIEDRFQPYHAVNGFPMCRRPDFCNVLPSCVQAIELKSGALVSEHISDKVYQAAYPLNMALKYNRPVHLTFTSPIGIKDGAKIALSSIGQSYTDKSILLEGKEYKYRIKVDYIRTQDLALNWLSKIIRQNPYNAVLGIILDTERACPNIFDSGVLEELKKRYSIQAISSKQTIAA